jgi:hypothetical protein
LSSRKPAVASPLFFGWLNSDRINGPLDVLSKTLKNIVSSAAEAETGGIYTGGKHACPILAHLNELGHKQPVTGSPFETDNCNAQGVLNSKIRPKHSKSFDMHYWWMKDRIHQGQFDLIWAPSKFNLADSFTKHHPPWHHRKMRHKYLQKLNCTLQLLQTRNIQKQAHPACQWARVCQFHVARATMYPLTDQIQVWQSHHSLAIVS